MSDEPVIDETQENRSTDKWKPALKAGLALIAVWVFLFIFVVIIKWALSAYFRPLWVSWWEYDTGRYPVYSAIYNLLFGCILFALAVLPVAKKGWRAALFDELQLKISKPAMNYFAIGLGIGAFTVVAIDLVTTLSEAYLFNGFLYVGLISERLAVAVLMIVPLLVLSIGQVALVQGYFQRTISKNYGSMAGLIVAAFIITLLFIFPNLSGFLYSPLYVAGYLITGFVIAYLFMRSKSLYMPIGFTFAWYVLSRFWDGFTSVYWGRTIPTFHGFSLDLFTYTLMMLIPFLVLQLVWYFGDKPPEELDELKERLHNAVNFFRFHDEED